MGGYVTDLSDEDAGAAVAALMDLCYQRDPLGANTGGMRLPRHDNTTISAKRVSAAELGRCTLRYADIGTLRRMGALLEREGVSAV